MDARLKMLIDEGYAFHLASGDKVVIGSDPKADIVVKNNISISRKHALLEFQKGLLFLTSFGQTNVFLNGFSIPNLVRTRLQENDFIKLSESGPELLVEEIGMEKKIMNEKKKKQAARIRRGFYLLFLLVSFLTFIILYMDTSFNLRIFELIGSNSFSLANLPFFHLQADKNNRELAGQSQEAWVTDEVILATLDNQLVELVAGKSQNGGRSGVASEWQILNPGVRFADAAFLILSTNALQQIICDGTAYAIKKNGFVCTLSRFIKGAQHIYLKNREHYFSTRVVYQDNEHGVALLHVPFTTKPLSVRIITKKDIGIDVYALDFSSFPVFYSGAGLSSTAPVITFKKGMLSGLTEQGTLVTDIFTGTDNSGGLLVDTNNAVIGIYASLSQQDADLFPGKSAPFVPAIINIKTLADLTDFSG